VRTLGIVGGSATGRARMAEALVRALAARGLAVSVVRRARDMFDPDVPGKDSRRHRDAGARETMVASAARFTLLHEGSRDAEPDAASLLARLAPADVVLLDGLPGAEIEIAPGADPGPALARLGFAP